MTGRAMRVAVVAQAQWATDFRSYVHDHMQNMVVEALLDRSQFAPGGFDVVVVDDSTRVLSGYDVTRAVAAGTVTVGVFDAAHPAGEAFLEGLGVSRVYRSDVDTATLAGLIASIGPVRPDVTVVEAGPRRNPGRRGALTAVSSANGGSGLTELLVAVSQRWSASRKVLVIEANPLTAGLAARLRRPPEWGLAWVLGLVSQGRELLPGALTPMMGPEGRGLGDFDLICQSSQPGGPPLMNPAYLDLLLDETLGAYDDVVVEVGPLVLDSSSPSDRFAAGRRVLRRADQVLVVARGEAESVLDLAAWRAATVGLELRAPCHAVFAGTRGRFEPAHLQIHLAEVTGDAGWFASVSSLPYDRRVAKNRWNHELTCSGRWARSVADLARRLAGPALLGGEASAEPAVAGKRVPAGANTGRAAMSKAWS